MHFDNRSEWGENSSYVYDFSGEGNNGTIIGSGISWNSSGKFGGAYTFSGEDGNRIDIPDSASINTSNVTLSFWMNAKSFWDAANVIPFRKGIWQDYGWYLWTRDTDKGLALNVNNATNTYTYYSNTNVLSLNKWQHIVVVFNLTYYAFYVNGADELSVTIPEGYFELGDDDLRIGTYGNDYEYNGTIDEVAMWNRSLTAQEILDLYRLESTQPGTGHMNSQ
jgi:hypothetical protein